MRSITPARPQPRLQSCQGSGRRTFRCRPLHTIAPSSAPSAALFREGRRRRDGATGTTGTGLLLVTTAHSIMPAEGSKRIGCQLPGAHHCARSEPARGSARLLTARTPARPDFPFSRLISRLECAQLRTRSGVREGQAVAWAAHNGRAVGTSQKRLRREWRALLRTPSTRHPGQPAMSISGFPTRSIAHVQADQNAKLMSILRTRSAQLSRSGSQPERLKCARPWRRSACNWPPSTCSLMARSAACPELVEGLKRRIGRENGVKRRTAR